MNKYFNIGNNLNKNIIWHDRPNSTQLKQKNIFIRLWKKLLRVLKLEFIFQISKYCISDHLLLQSLSLIFFWQSKLSRKLKHQWYRKIGTHIWRNSCTVFYWVSLYCEMINLPISTCKHKVLSGRDVLAQLWFTFSFLQQALKRNETQLFLSWNQNCKTNST